MNQSHSEPRTYRLNHYVPQAYQRRFLPDSGEQKFYYLDQRPPLDTSGGQPFQKKALNRWGPSRCFCEYDLYTSRFGPTISTEIETDFFGPIDARSQNALDFFDQYKPMMVDNFCLHALTDLMSIQKFRTPKGLAWLNLVTRGEGHRTALLLMQRLRGIHTDTWLEGIWQIADAKESPTKFIVSDHPVTVFNGACPPLSRWCAGPRDPDVWMNGSHTLFPLSQNKILIVTNLSWVRNTYADPKNLRPNPGIFRGAVFRYQDIQTDRMLSEREVREINFIIKSRSYRFVAAAKPDWLYPERFLDKVSWKALSEQYLLMPDPRSVPFGTTIHLGYKDGRGAAYDIYGNRPGQPNFNNKNRSDREWQTFHRFQGEFARLFGPQRRGRSTAFGDIEPQLDDDEFHRHILSQETTYAPVKAERKPKRAPKRRGPKVQSRDSMWRREEKSD